MDEIAVRYATDKSHGHGYTSAVYPQFFDQIRYLPVSFLEIGVLRGASLRMWEDYFTHPDKKMFAWDIDGRQACLAPEGWTFQEVDCINARQVREAAAKLPMLDVVVDDGAHDFEHVMTNFNHLWDKLSPGGLYVIEDQKFKRQAPLVTELMKKKGRESLHIYGEAIIMRKL
jgi:cephalosporin hydroxylase